MIRNKQVLLTGATSFIGNALIRQLLSKTDCDIVAIIRTNSVRKYTIPKSNRIHIIETELDDLDKIEDACMKNVETIFHIGWSSDFLNPRYNLSGQLQNVIYMEKVIALARKCACKKLVCIGSQAECGRVEGAISETTPSNPETAYGVAKCQAYDRGMELCSKYDIRLFWPRLLSAYGANDKNKTLIMSCLDAAINHKKIEFTKCEQIWDYIYVDDVADALIAIAEHGMSGIKYSIASGEGRELRKYIEDIANITSNQDILDGLGRKAYDDKQIMYLVGDIRRLTQDTGFRPQVSFVQGIQSTICTNYTL